MEWRTVVYAILVAFYAFAFIRVVPIVTIVAVAVAAIWPFVRNRITCRKHVMLAILAAGIATLVYAVIVGAKSDDVVAIPYLLFGLFGLLGLYDTKR